MIAETAGQIFWRRWRSEYQRQGQRLGQAFINHFNLSQNEQTKADLLIQESLFYTKEEENAKRAIEHFFTAWGSH